MVYCGIPSKACAECRARRTKCDYLMPSCSQCLRMGRTCKGYRDPVASLFRDESKGFATKRQRLTGPKKSPTTSSRKSSEEIDKALAACSTMFEMPPVSDSDPNCGNHVLFELMVESNPLTDDQGTCFLDTNFAPDESKFHHGNYPPISSFAACEEVKDALAENFASLGIARIVSDVMVNANIRHNMVFMERFYLGYRQGEKFVLLDPTLENSNICEDNSIGIEPRLDFAQDPDPEHKNHPFLANVSWSIELQAPCYFFANYVLEDTECSKGYLNYLPSLCENEGMGSFLMDAITSLGLVGIAMRKQDSNALNLARLKYASALNQLNVALTSNEGALTDQALTTVFLLGLYETNTCSTPHNLRAWTKHIRGAIAMLQLRGKEQLESLVGRQLFVQWRSQIVTYCLHRRISIPEFILEWSHEMMPHETQDEAMATTLYMITAKICALRDDMEYFRNYSKSGSAVPWALAIDAELEAWANDCPASYKYTSVTLTETSEFVYDNHFHVYSSVTIATLWNECRRMRILCHELLLQHLPHLIEHQAEYPNLQLSSDGMETQFHDSNEIIESLAKDICASVPFHFGLHLQDARKFGTLSPKAVCGNLLLRPLYMAGEPRFVSNDIRKWVIGRLEKIAEVMGIKQATSLAHLVKIGVDPDQWEDTIRD